MTNTTTVEKVRIPAEVAEAIRYYKSNIDGPAWSNEKIVRWFIDHDAKSGIDGALASFARERLDDLIRALYNGYDIEKPPKKITLELTPEELGTIVASLNVVNDDDARDSARETNYEFSDNPLGVWQKLSDIYEQEARA
ncbi:hypothetical protein [Aneurinibacillus aneurinilyticus]|uniref:hypothetical protein n=1 Tax=Aneurinibacillus aneurinilyticus TaxID=1391 RepID=UPI0023F15EFC|nr:hypothetical protein [Aneurinibacillus aneurinilyticus]